ncbi:MAG: hypothetical protein WBA74_27685 [Cyclobacteriaceae bacterium]
MRILVTLTMLGFLISCNNKTEYQRVSAGPEGSTYPTGAIIEPYSDIPGLAKVTSKRDDLIVGEGDYLNGKKHGSWTVYNRDGGLQSVTTYNNGVKQGTHLEFGDRGTLTKKEYYYNGQLDGEAIVYNNMNRIQERITYAGGQMHGPKRTFYSTGTPQEESNYTNGQIDGIAKYYNQEGELLFTYEYKNGVLVDQEKE